MVFVGADAEVASQIPNAVPIIPPQGVSTFTKIQKNNIERIRMFDDDGSDLAQYLEQVSPRWFNAYLNFC